MKQSKRRVINLSLFSGSIAELLHPPAGQIPFLDGLRSIAVLLVISYHSSGNFVAAYGPNLFSRIPFVADGWVGVDLFFVLSGFFIGSQLWKELRDRRTIDVGRFVLRRGFRIWPLYFFTFLCVYTYNLVVGRGASILEHGWTDLIFITNFFDRGIVMGGWSLCTEEQFYIVTPLALFFCARFVRSIPAYRSWLWGMLLPVLLFRALVWVHLTGGHIFLHNPLLFDEVYGSSLTHCEGLIMGLIIANLWVTNGKAISTIATPGILVAVAVALMFALHQVQKEIFDFTVLALVFGSLVWFGLQRRVTIFNSRVFYWISRLSFGMYLNHQYMCPWVVRVLLPRLPFLAQLPALTNLIGFVLVALISAAIALVTFCGVEYPFLQMRKALLGRRSGPYASSDRSPVLK
jgi:peptidoglycan/LPS O-acetylase OafA/YrhL